MNKRYFKVTYRDVNGYTKLPFIFMAENFAEAFDYLAETENVSLIIKLEEFEGWPV